MSEKVGGGDSWTQNPEQGQELLDWKDLPSYDEFTQPATVRSAQETATTSEQAAAERTDRLTAQARGELLLRAVAESLPEEQNETLLLEAENDDHELRGGIDTVVVRARQALGEEKFAGLTHALLELSYTAEPEQVTEKFRNEAQKYSTIDAGDLWEAVVHSAKIERFAEGDIRNMVQRKFYYSTSLKDLGQILKSGQLMRTDSEGSPLKSNLKFSYDYLEDGEWRSGFAMDRDAKSDEVTMVFDASLLDEDSFMPFGKNPSASTVDWKKSCLGLVVEPENLAGLRRALSMYGGREDLPFYPLIEGQDGTHDWRKTMQPAAGLLSTRAHFVEQMKRAMETAKMIYEGGANEIINNHVDELASRVRESDIRKFYDRYSNITNKEQYKQMMTELVDYYKGIFGIIEPVDTMYYYDSNSPYDIACRHVPYGPETICVNEAKISKLDVRSSIAFVGHEMFHAYQGIRSDVHADGSVKRPPDQEKYDELCYLSFLAYIDADVDVVAYKGQFVEREAYRFGDAIYRKCDEVEAKDRTLVSRLRKAYKRLREQ